MHFEILTGVPPFLDVFSIKLHPFIGFPSFLVLGELGGYSKELPSPRLAVEWVYLDFF